MLLHGMGATAAAWEGVRQLLEARAAVRWLTPDLSGHGGSDWQEGYSVGQLAAALVPLWPESGAVFVVGHSVGAYVGLALAGGGLGVRVRGVLGIGPKIAWPPADLAAARELAARPVRWYPGEAEALLRYRRVSGLSADIAPAPQMLARGVVRGPDGWRLAQDPRTFAVAAASFGSLAGAARARLALARGESDPMVTAAELRAHAGDVHTIAGAGHNAHVEQPAAVVALLERLIHDCGGPDH
ncbi:MAG TPA: alpha/beta hydrolase [Steroidobacteraceae bacterium]|nr:alpha/beta hydrolase [Steroidobacteraceae bacterium]